jgi:hypothetical protein
MPTILYPIVGLADSGEGGRMTKPSSGGGG